MTSSPLIWGIVLAAGQSRRMGRPKALLRCAPTSDTFITRIVGTFREATVSNVVVVGRPDDEALRSHVAELRPQVEYVENPAPMRGQLSSLITGLERAEACGAAAVLVMPVDTPLVRAGSIARVLAAAAESSALIVRATHQGRHGHPVLFRAPIFTALRTADPTVGAKAVLHTHAEHVLNVEVDDPGVLRDFDAPEDYERTFRLLPE
ncbi:MAG: nucleotidyltransferase family protein [Vicinamibacterales bacterium]